MVKKSTKHANSFALVIEKTVASFLLAIGILSVVSGPNSQRAFAQIPQEVLKSIPSDVQHIFVIDMQRFAQSPMYPRIMREKEPMVRMIDAILSFALSTGVDLARDVSCLVLTSTKQGPVMVADGRFERERIDRYLRCSMHAKEKKYKETPMLIFPSEASGMGIALISRQMIAVGNPDQLKAIADANAGKKKNIMSDPQMASIIGAGPSGEMIWFAGRSGRILSIVSIPYPLSPVYVYGTISSTGTFMGSSVGSSDPFTRSIKGSLDITDSITGKISLTTGKEGDAKTLAKNWDASRPSRDFMAEGLTVDRNGSKIELSLNIPADALERLWEQKDPHNSQNLKAPVPFLRPMPPYSEEAQKARVQGTMQIELIVREDGTTDKIKVLKELGYGMEQSAIATITEFWRFLPALRNNKPIEMRTTFDLPFTLKDERWK